MMDLVTAIKSATSDMPAIVRLEIWPEGIGNAPPPQEFVVKLFPVDVPVIIPPPPPPVPPPPITSDTVLSARSIMNVRKTPSINGTVLGQLGFGQVITVTGDPINADTHIWRAISKGPIAGGYVATDLMQSV